MMRNLCKNYVKMYYYFIRFNDSSRFVRIQLEQKNSNINVGHSANKNKVWYNTYK